MKNLIFRYIKKFLESIFILFLKFDSLSKIITIINLLDVYETKEVFGKKIYLNKKNFITKYRNDTILSKEPETIQWIQNMEKDSIFWDVGSNIGLYSIVAALLNSKKIVAFEPSFFNLQVLSKNIYKNKLTNKIIIIPISLDDNIKEGLFNLKSIEEGGALSNFSNDNSIIKDSSFNYNTVSITLDEFYNKFDSLSPDYLKIDVDGIETKILNGGSKVLKNIKSVLVESNSDDDEKKITKIMNDHNLILENNVKSKFNLIFNKL